MRMVMVEALRVRASIGILEHELLAPQQLLISITVEMPDAPVLPEGDEVTHVLDYRRLREIAKELSEVGHINLLETLAGRIALALLRLPGVKTSHVRVSKPNVFSDCDGVHVAVTSHRALTEPS